MRHRFAMFAVLCTLAFLRVPAAGAQTTALFFDSQPGEPIGRGRQQTWTQNDLAFVVTSGASRSHIRISADNFALNISPSTWWYLEFESANGADLAPGVYEYAGPSFSAPANRPAFDISGSGVGCDGIGRFVIHEVVFTGAGQLSRFAADFEQHCGDQVPALFGAIRINSTRSTLVPFDGAYPFYALHLNPSPFGAVTGAGFDCGNGGAACDAPFVTAETVTLTATPAPGYQFLAWTGYCSGRPRVTSVVVSQRKWCAALFDAIPGSGMPPAFGGGTLLFVDRAASLTQPARRWMMQPSDAQFDVGGGRSSLSVTVTAFDGQRWDLTMTAPTNQVLAPGLYDRAQFYYGSVVSPGFNLGGGASGCNTLPRFFIYEIAFDGNGRLTRLAADFEARCGPTDTGGMFGAIRYNATRTTVVPFDGVYPVYSLTIAPPIDGRIIAAGIDCGSGGGDCDETYSTGRTIAVTAVPAPGHIFLGWTGDCGGPSTTSVAVIARHRCGAVFDNAPDATGAAADNLRRGSLYFFSPRSEYVGAGRRRLWTGSDIGFRVTPTSSSDPRRGVDFAVDATDGTWWYLDFVAPAGQALRVGDFNGAARYPVSVSSTAPGLNVSGDGRGCGNLTGRFRVYEVAFDSAGKVTSFAADFEQRCEGSTVSLFGAIRYNSTRASVQPFDGAFLPRPDMSLDLPLDGSTVAPTFVVGGWALNQAESSGTGVDAVHVYVYPLPSGAPEFLGIATYGVARSDLASRFGSQFRNSGFSFATPALAPGRYLIAAIAHDTVTGTFNTVRTATVTVSPPVPSPRLAVDTPSSGASIVGALSIDGWAVDTGALADSGVDAVHVYAFAAGSSTPIFLGAATLGLARPDIGALYGPQFAAAGFHLNAPGLPSGTYLLYVAARSTVSGQYLGTTRTITVTSTAMSIDTPANGSHPGGWFLVAGWAFDAAASSGSGIDAVHVWAVPAGGGTPLFLGAATLGASRSDIGAIYGARFANAGFNLFTAPLPPGTYTLAVSALSSATGTFNQMKTVTVIVP